MPTVVVWRSEATEAIDTFITEVSSVIRNCAEASSTNSAADAERTVLEVVTPRGPSASDRRGEAPPRGLDEPGERRVGPRQQLGVPLHAEDVGRRRARAPRRCRPASAR